MSITKWLGEILRPMRCLGTTSTLPRDKERPQKASQEIDPAGAGVPRHPELIAEAAMCIWEFMLASRPHGYPDQSETTWTSLMDVLWETHGTVELRHHAYRLALSALDVFDMLGREWIEEKDILPYDWEFIPLVVRMTDWTSLYAADNRPERIANEIRKLHGDVQVGGLER